MSTTISVVIPTHNRSVLVRQAIDSVLNQRCHANFEIIVIDDGSIDDTPEVLAGYGDKIRYVRQENAGLNAARNHALSLAKGEYIALLDDDDVWLPFKTELQLKAIEHFPEAAFVHSNFYIWKPDASHKADGLSTWFPDSFGLRDLYPRSVDIHLPDYPDYDLEITHHEARYGDIYYWSLLAPMVLPSTAIVRRSAFGSDLRFPEDDWTCGDWDMFAQLSKGQGGVFVAQETTLNRSHEDEWRLTRIEESIQLERRIAMIQRIWRQDAAFMKQHGAEVDQQEARILRRLARVLFLAGKREAARQKLQEAKRMCSDSESSTDKLIRGLTRVPFAHALVSLIRRCSP